MEAAEAGRRRNSSGAAKSASVAKHEECEESASTESSSSVAADEAAELLANCLSSPDPSDVTEGLKALEALVTRHPECAGALESLGVLDAGLRLARLLPNSVQTLSLDPVQNYAVLLLCTLSCTSETSRILLRERTCPVRLAGLVDQTRPNSTDAYAGKVDVAIIVMILIRQLMRSPDYRKAYPEKEVLATSLADHITGAKDEEAVLNAMDLVTSVTFAQKNAQLAFDRPRGVAALLKHISGSQRMAIMSLKTLGSVLTDNAKLQAQNVNAVFPLLCPMIKDENTPQPLLVAATTALGLACDTDSSAKRRVVSEGMLEVIVSLLERRIDELREAGLSALRCFARTVRAPVLAPGMSEWRSLVRQHGALLPMAALIGAPHVGTRTQALGGVLEAIKDHKENIKLVHGIVLQHASVLVAGMTQTIDPNLQYYALGVLCSVCYKKSRVRSFAAVPGLRERVFALMASDNEVVRVAANYTARLFM